LFFYIYVHKLKKTTKTAEDYSMVAKKKAKVAKKRKATRKESF